ncbi:MAG: hypothetical protein AAF357_03020 [Verrucomicrobiota bacterium]
MKTHLVLATFFALTLLSISDLRSEAWTGPLAQIAKVGPEGAGNAEAASAWADLTRQGPEVIVPVLAAMESAGPLARNWMRSAVETVFDKQLAASSADLPTVDLKSFFLDRENEPLARSLAFDLYHRVAPDDADAIIPEFIDDPSPELRRQAVAKLIDEGQNLLNQGRNEESITTLASALDAAREVDQINAIAKLLREKLGQKVDLPRQFGFLMYWDLIAPFDNTDRRGFDMVYPPEESIDVNATYPGKDGNDLSWQAYSTSDDYGMVDFNQPFSPLKQVVGYAYTEFHSAETRDAQLRLGCKNAWKIWLNGDLVFGRDEYHRGIRIDQYTHPVQLQEGKNTLLVKACQNEQTQSWTVQWQFQLRVTDETGTALLSTDRKPTPEPTAPARRTAE